LTLSYRLTQFRRSIVLAHFGTGKRRYRPLPTELAENSSFSSGRTAAETLCTITVELGVFAASSDSGNPRGKVTQNHEHPLGGQQASSKTGDHTTGTSSILSVGRSTALEGPPFTLPTKSISTGRRFRQPLNFVESACFGRQGISSILFQVGIGPLRTRPRRLQ